MSVEHVTARNAALDLIQYLQAEYVVEECKGDMMFGCVSCQAIQMIDTLHALALEIEERNLESFA